MRRSSTRITRDARADLDSQRFTIALIDDVEGSEFAPAVQRVVHEIGRPDSIVGCRSLQRTDDPSRQALLRSTR